jgi:hypothetical protein
MQVLVDSLVPDNHVRSFLRGLNADVPEVEIYLYDRHQVEEALSGFAAHITMEERRRDLIVAIGAPQGNRFDHVITSGRNAAGELDMLKGMYDFLTTDVWTYQPRDGDGFASMKLSVDKKRFVRVTFGLNLLWEEEIWHRETVDDGPVVTYKVVITVRTITIPMEMSERAQADMLQRMNDQAHYPTVEPWPDFFRIRAQLAASIG